MCVIHTMNLAQSTLPRLTPLDGVERKANSSRPDSGPLNSARDLKMLVDLGQRLLCLPEVVRTSLRPDLVLWSESQRWVFIVELTVPWEDAVDETNE